MQAVVEFEPMHSVPRTGLLADWTAGALCRKDPIEVFTNAQNWQYCHYCQLCIPMYLKFPSLSVPYDASKYEIRYLWIQNDQYLTGVLIVTECTKLVTLFIFNMSTADNCQLAILTSTLYCGAVLEKLGGASNPKGGTLT